VRLFVAVVPPDEVLDRVAAMERPDVDGVRWTARDQWHVTLRFLGAVDHDRTHDLVAALSAALAEAPSVEAVMGPATARFGSSILHAPVAGLEPLAAAVDGATTAFVAPRPPGRPDDHPFHGHLTLARGRGRRARVPAALAGKPVSGRWIVDDVDLVASELHPTGSRYTTVATFPLRP
jgi:2'-5' RNA ligase